MNIVKYYFVGWFSGMVIFPMGDINGRKPMLTVLIFIAILANYQVVYSKNLQIKAIGLFLQGFFHIRTNLSYVYLFEVVQNDMKRYTTSFVNFTQASVIPTVCCWFILVNNNCLQYLEVTYWVGVFASLFTIVCLLVETPVFLLIQNKEVEAKKKLQFHSQI